MPFTGPNPKDFDSICQRCGEGRGKHYTTVVNNVTITYCPDEVGMWADGPIDERGSYHRAKRFVKKATTTAARHARREVLKAESAIHKTLRVRRVGLEG